MRDWTLPPMQHLTSNGLKKHLPVFGLVLLTAADTYITSIFWQYEANPIVTSIGSSMFLAVKAIGTAAIVAVWLIFHLHESNTAWRVILAYDAMMALITLYNLLVLPI